MSVALVNVTLELAGGGEKLTLDMSKALEELGFDVTVYTYCSSIESVEKTLKLLSPNYRPRVVAKSLPSWYKVLEGVVSGRFVRFRRLALVEKLLNEVKRDSKLLIDVSSNAPTKADVVYVHYPALLPSGRSSLHWKLYDGLIKFIGNRVYGEPRLVLANSSWTLTKFKDLYGDRFKLEVLHPCIDPEFFMKHAEKRGDMIITISRFSPEKNLEGIIYVAREMPEFKFYLVGSSGRYSRKVIERLRSLMSGLNVKNVTMLTNVPRGEVKELLSKAAFYLHPPFPEHFGIAVVEAIASGCIPIVYADGGVWTDITSRIDQSLGYHSIVDVPRIIREIISEGKTEELRGKALMIAREFTFEKFKEKLENIMGLVT
ncbi:MAG: glycosyltransferase [Candidatus Nezhaarchaeota archaeon]|nr:glycosyltransferase [Candidatus Nezhaarchaeota archaeon]